MVNQTIVEQIRVCLHESWSSPSSVDDKDRWSELFRAFQSTYCTTQLDDIDDQHAILSFLNEVPRVCPCHASQVDSVLKSLIEDESWISSIKSLVQKGLVEGPVLAQFRSERNAFTTKIEDMVSDVLVSHPDADVLIPLALLEVATEDEHRTCLAALVAEPQRFKEYVFTMVSAVAPTEVPNERSEKGSTAAGVVPHAEVRSAYLQLAKQYHPDKGGDKDMFITLQAAYEMLRADRADAKEK